jgi:phosphoadenosine phosphosulfate reductase
MLSRAYNNRFVKNVVTKQLSRHGFGKREFSSVFNDFSRKYHHTAKTEASQAVSLDVGPNHDLNTMNQELQSIIHSPSEILRWANFEFDGRLAMSTSFGIQSAILLHLAVQVKPDIPVVWVDTGYLPEETYHYAQQLTEILGLNLKIVSNSEWSPARMEAVYGKLWEKDDAESHALYGKLRKVEPLNQGLASLEPNPLVLLSGLRATQTKARSNMKPISMQGSRFKILPILKMTDEQVVEYMDKYDLPQHPLQAKGYVTVGDWHSSRPVEEGEDPRNTRFGGKFQECGLHVDESAHESVANQNTAIAEQQNIPLVLEPESLEKTNIAALGETRAHRETDMAVIMVKKLTEDGSFCRKCNDVAGKIEADGIGHLIGHTSVANVLDHQSEGSKLAKHFSVPTAPFFLVRTLEEERKKSEWTVIRSYLQLKKKLEIAAEVKLEKAGKVEVDPERQELMDQIDALKQSVNHIQIDLRAKQLQLETAELQLSKLSPHH